MGSFDSLPPVLPLFGVARASELLGLSIRGLYVVIERGEIRHYRMGRRIRLDESCIREYLARVQQPPMDSLFA